MKLFNFFKRKKPCCKHPNLIYGNPKQLRDSIRAYIDKNYDVCCSDGDGLYKSWIRFYDENNRYYAYSYFNKKVVPCVCANCHTIVESGEFKKEMNKFKQFIFDTNIKLDNEYNDKLKRSKVDKFIRNKLENE